MTQNAVMAGIEGPADDSSTGSYTHLIREVIDGSEEAVQQLLLRLYESSYYRNAVRKAHLRLGSAAGSGVGGEDILQEAFATLAERARQGKLNQLDSRERLFEVLRLVVATRIRDALRRAKALKRIPEDQLVRGDDVSPAMPEAGSLFSNLPDSEKPGTVEVVQTREVLRQLQENLDARYGDDERVQAVLSGLLFGHTLREIMRQLGATWSEMRTILEKIRQAAAALYSDEFPL